MASPIYKRCGFRSSFSEGQTAARVGESTMTPVVAELPAPVNEAKVRSLQQRLRLLSSHQQRVFTLLTEQDTPLTVEQIAAWLGVARSTAQSYLPPEALLKIGLVKRFRSGNAYVYTSALKEYLTKNGLPPLAHGTHGESMSLNCP